MRIVGYKANAEVVCLGCAPSAWEFDREAVDGEGNPIVPVYDYEESADSNCGVCLGPIAD